MKFKMNFNNDFNYYYVKIILYILNNKIDFMKIFKKSVIPLEYVRNKLIKELNLLGSQVDKILFRVSVYGSKINIVLNYMNQNKISMLYINLKKDNFTIL